jgi:hypothetical protein
MDAAGVFPADLHLEVIDGDWIEIPADGSRTIEWNVEINRRLITNAGPDIRVAPDKSLHLSEHDEPVSDSGCSTPAWRWRTCAGLMCC